VLVFFTVEPGHRPRITGVQRGARRAPPFSPTAFTIPGTVRDTERDRPFAVSGNGLLTRIGTPGITVQLDLPSSIPVDDAAVEPLSGPSLIRARLHKGFLEHRYLDDVRLIGRGWTPESSFAYDDARGRLVVLNPRETSYRRPMLAAEEKPQSDVFFFDGLGKEQGSASVPGRLIEGVVDPASGHVLALVSERRWSYTEVSLIRIRDDGQVTERSPLVAYDRILGFDGTTGRLWVLVGLASASRTGPYFIERMTFAGPLGPRLGPFVSQPTHHRITQLELASGRTVLEYRELNGPTDIAVDAGVLYVIEAEGTQLTKFAGDGRVVWRLPRFQGLAWAVAEPGTGAGLIGATRFDGRPAGVLRVGPDGTVTRMASGPGGHARDWRRRLIPDAVRSARDGRLYLLGNDTLEILGPDGAPLNRINGFRFPTEQRVRS
jgi:hypothetical protein